MNLTARTVRSFANLILAIVIAAGLASNPATAAEQAPAKPSAKDLPVEAIKDIVRQTILENPEIIGEALLKLRQKKRQAKTQRAKRMIAARRAELLNDPDSPVGGNPRGDVTVIEFFDYNCAYCRRTAPAIAELLRQDPAVRLVYKEYPILGSSSVFAAQAALAARAQGKYVALHEALMNAKGALSQDKIMEIAASVGIDTARLRKDMGDPAIMDAISRNRVLARALGTKTTPSFVIGEELVRGQKDLQTLKRLITAARAR